MTEMSETERITVAGRAREMFDAGLISKSELKRVLKRLGLGGGLYKPVPTPPPTVETVIEVDPAGGERMVIDENSPVG